MSHNFHNCCCAEHTAIKIEDLSVTLNGVSILSHITASIPRGVCTAIVGPNGAGKSTLAKAILGDIEYKGKVFFGQTDGSFSRRQPRWGYVPQKLQFDRNMPLTCMEFLAASISCIPLFWRISKSIKKRIMDMLEAVECPHLVNRQLGKLSGGEMQRILLAMALLQDPEVVVLDEPAAGVDFQGEKLCCGLLEKFRKERKFTQLMISHDLATVAAHAAHVIILKNSVLAQGHPAEVLTEENLRSAFGMHTAKFDLVDHREVCTCSKK